MSLKHELKRTLWKLGYDISPFNPQSSSLARRKKLIESYSINVILDVGANTGGFAIEMRKDLGFSGKIISFEPLSSAFELLKKNAKSDPKWKVLNCALGMEESTMAINIAGNSDSSSLLNMLPAHSKAAPESDYIGKEIVQIKTLDSIMDELCSYKDNIYLKIDTQGYEKNVLIGANKSLSRIETIQLEMPLVPLYENEILFGEMHAMLLEKGYILVSIEPGMTNHKTGQLLQIDGIYHKF